MYVICHGVALSSDTAQCLYAALRIHRASCTDRNGYNGVSNGNTI